MVILSFLVHLKTWKVLILKTLYFILHNQRIGFLHFKFLNVKNRGTNILHAQNFTGQFLNFKSGFPLWIIPCLHRLFHVS